MMQNEIINDYFEWLIYIVCGERYNNTISFRKLLMHLHSIPFRYSLPRDVDRAKNGEFMRYHYSYAHGMEDVPDCLYGPCSVLEMMIALARACEDSIFDNPDMGDRTGQWFWDMIVNLGLGHMIDRYYDRDEVEYKIGRFLDREYEPDGTGGLFRLKNCDRDLRTVEIWTQMCWYANTII